MNPQSQALDEPRKPHVEIKLCVGPTKLKGFQFLIITHNLRNNCSSFFKVGLITSSLEINLPKEKIIVFN
jgi:hypothetical protein